MPTLRGITKKHGKDMMLVLNKEDVKKYGLKVGQMLIVENIRTKE